LNVVLVFLISTFIYILDRKHYISTCHILSIILFSSTSWYFHPTFFLNKLESMFSTMTFLCEGLGFTPGFLSRLVRIYSTLPEGRSLPLVILAFSCFPLSLCNSDFNLSFVTDLSVQADCKA